MKKFFRIIVISVFIFTLAFPLLASANHRTGSSSLRRKISALDDDPVQNLALPIFLGITPDNIVRNFGDPRSGGRTHEGLDILAPMGAPIVSPTQAVVIRVGEGDSAGYYVYTANPGGETFAYMHLQKPSDLDDGDEINKGDLIGYVGKTGNAINTVPHLHFEIHDDGDPIDPFPRLTRIFPLADKMAYITEIINDIEEDDEDDVPAFIDFLIRTYRQEFVLARSLAIPIPPLVEVVLLASAAPIITSTSGSLNLTLGSRGPAVTALQNFLILKNVGSGGTLIADGSFGRLTQTALGEYQASVGISPAAGYYGPITRAYIAAHP